VVSIYNMIQKEMPSRLVLLGEGPERQKAEEQARDLGILDQLIFLGKTNEIERVLCMSDVFLLPSEKESFGLAALEAMAAKVPVLSTNTGGLPEVNIDGVTGYTANVGDINRLAEKGIDMLKNAQLHEQLKQSAYEQALKFDIKNIVPLYINLYKRVLAEIRV